MLDEAFQVEITKYGRKIWIDVSKSLHLLTEMTELLLTSKRCLKETLRGGLSIILCITAWIISFQLHKRMQRMERLRRARTLDKDTHLCRGRGVADLRSEREGTKTSPHCTATDWTSTTPEQAQVRSGSEPAAIYGDWFLGSTLADRKGKTQSFLRVWVLTTTQQSHTS